MPTLRSGLVIAGGYADKVRRVLFAQLKDKIKNGEIDAKKVAQAAGELNRLLFEILVTNLQVDKGDVVRISVDYEIGDGEIKWLLDTLTVQVWKRVPDEEVESKLKSVVSRAEEVLEEEPSYQLEKLGETDTGDIVFKLVYQDQDAGAIMITPINGQAIVRASVLVPAPKVIKKKIVEVSGDIDSYLEDNLSSLLSDAEDVEKRIAERIYREILALVSLEDEEEES
ncbi:MAG: DUF2258 domain-containing protein [Desulfurococcales archaeon]|nr:DUF2258 domain-containing protein [Desulfurococcales archaeon]